MKQGTPLKFGACNLLGPMIASPELDKCGAAIRTEFGPEQASGSAVVLRLSGNPVRMACEETP